MKFTNGFWLLRDGITLHPAIAPQAPQVGEAEVDLLVATRAIEHRGQTLNIGTIQVQFSSPAPNVIRVRATHHAGGREPIRFPITESEVQPDIRIGEGRLDFTSGQLTARVDLERFGIEWRAGDEVIARQGEKALFYANTPAGRYISGQISLGVGEQVYGFGERFTAFVKNGQSIDIYNEDPGTCSEQAYKNLPFYLSNRGYGVLVNHTGRVSYEVGSETVNQVQFTVAGEQVEYLFILGPSPKDVLSRYTALTGRPKLPPAWSFGLWLSTSFVTDYDEQTVTEFIEEMARRDIPLSVFHFDCFWMREFQWVDFQWDPRVFPDPAGMLRRLKERGLRISVWINPYIAQASPLFAEAKAAGYLLCRPDGSVWQWDLWQAGNAIVDFTNPAAAAWFQSKLEPLLEMGVDCFKTDFGERIPTDVVYHDGSNPEQMHNLYTQLYNRTVYHLLMRRRPEDAIVFARSATVGGQQMPVHWGGDNSSNFESMAESLRGGLSLGLGGFGFWSHDIGGFEGSPDPEVFKRWVAFGALSSHSRLHGNESVRVPWAFDDEAVAVTRKFIRLKNRLMPYLYRLAREAADSGIPMMRPMLLEFPEDRNCWYLDEQYMLGDALLVAPVMTAGGRKQFYLPAGRWTSLLTGEVVDGGGWRTEVHAIDSLPLYVRERSLLMLGRRDDTAEYDYLDEAEAKVFQLAAGESVSTEVFQTGQRDPVRVHATMLADGSLEVRSG